MTHSSISFLTPILSLALSYSLSLTLYLTHTLSHSLSHTFYLSLSISHTLSLTLYLTLSISHTLIRSHCMTHREALDDSKLKVNVNAVIDQFDALVRLLASHRIFLSIARQLLHCAFHHINALMFNQLLERPKVCSQTIRMRCGVGVRVMWCDAM